MRTPFHIMILLLLAVVFAGCTDGDADRTNDEKEPETKDPLDGENETDVAEPVIDQTPVEETLYLDGSGLVTENPAAGSIPMAGSYSSCFVTRPCSVLTFESEPTDVPIALGPEPVRVTYWLATDSVVPSSGMFDHGVWVGSTYAMALNAIQTNNDVIVAGTPLKVEFTLEFGTKAPVFVPAGESVRVYLISGMAHEEAGTLKLLYGGDTPSAITYTRHNLTDDPLANFSAAGPTGFSSSLSGPGFPASGARSEPGEHYNHHSFTVGDNSTFIEVRLEQTGGPSEDADLDLDLYTADGDLVAGGHTPMGDEAILLGRPTVEGLRGEEMVLRVTLFSGVNVAYTVTVLMD